MQELAGLPLGIRSRMVSGNNGLDMHFLEAGAPDRPCVLLLHGFPELGYSWRKVMVPLAEAGFHVVAPDQRGYGRTTGADTAYDADLHPFRLLNLVRDAIGLVRALGHERVVSVIGHDFGSPVAAWCAVVRPDVFRSVVLMSAPFAGTPDLPVSADRSMRPPDPDIHSALAALRRPRKHYQWYYSSRAAGPDMDQAPQGLKAFLRAYYHVKSADWPANQPVPLRAWSADELARLPTYYVMDRDRTMPETVAEEMPSIEAIAGNAWLTEPELDVYVSEFARNGFQGGLQWYRCRTDPAYSTDLQIFAGRTIDVPSLFIAGRSDWGVYQTPSAFERMQRVACTQLSGCHLIEGAGHWVQQEQPEQVIARLQTFLGAQRTADC